MPAAAFSATIFLTGPIWPSKRSRKILALSFGEPPRTAATSACSSPSDVALISNLRVLPESTSTTGQGPLSDSSSIEP